jgi:hypothetical protein
MPINPNIALSARGIELQNPLDQYSKVMAIQNAQQQNALAQRQMQQSERDLASTNALNIAYKNAYNPNTGEVDLNALRGSLATGGYGSKLPAIEKSIFEGREAKTKALKGEADLFDTSMKQIRNAWGNVRTVEDAIAVHNATHADPTINGRLTALGVTEEMGRQKILEAAQNPAAFAEFVQRAQLGAEKFMEMNKPTLSNVDLSNKVVSQLVEPLTGKVTKVGEMTKGMAPGEAERIKLEGRRLGLEGRRVAVLEQNARRDADPVFQQNMAAAKETGIAIAKGDVAAVQALPKVITRAEETIRTIDQLIGKRDTKTGKLLKGEKTHPGFTGAVGATWLPGLRFVDGTDEASFMSRFDQIKGASFLEAFESLKGGGAITKDEGNKATDAINRMSIASDEKEFIRAAMDLQDVVRKGVANAQAKAARAGSRNAPAPAAGGGGVDTNNPLLK